EAAAVALPWLQGESDGSAGESSDAVLLASAQASGSANAVPPEAQPEEEEESGGFFSWLFGSDEDESAKEEPAPEPQIAEAPLAPLVNARGEVEVAEAIRVP